MIVSLRYFLGWLVNTLSSREDRSRNNLAGCSDIPHRKRILDFRERQRLAHETLAQKLSGLLQAPLELPTLAHLSIIATTKFRRTRPQ